MRGHSAAKKASLNGDWHKADIKAALEKAGWTIRQLAHHHQLNESTLRGALSYSYPASERRIANAIGLLPQLIWPSRYDEAGNPTGKRGRPSRVSKQPAQQLSTAPRARRGKGRSAN